MEIYLSQTASKDTIADLQLCKSFIDLELRSVEHSLRKAAIVKIKKCNLFNKKNEFRDLGLYFLALNWVQEKQGFYHKHVHANEDDENAVCTGVVSKKREDAEILHKAYFEKPANHIVIGEILGYPACCSHFFSKHWESGNIDTVWQQALNTPNHKLSYNISNSKIIDVEGYPECIAHFRYWGIQCCFHLPCSYKCEATKKRVSNYLEFFEKIKSEAGQQLYRMMQLDTTWAALRGNLLVYTPLFKASSNTDYFDTLHSINFKAIHS